MLNRNLLAGTLAAVCSATLLVANPVAQQQEPQQPRAQQPGAQQPQGQQPRTQRPQPNQTTATQTPAPTTVIGCVYREQDVPGRAPNVAERVGILEDYILMEIPGAAAASSAPATTARGAAGATGRETSETRGTTGAAATAGAAATTGKTGRMYKLEFVDDDRLQALVGRRVQVTGQIDAEEGDAKSSVGAVTSTTDEIIGRDQVNLSEFEVSAISELDGTCPSLTGDRQ